MKQKPDCCSSSVELPAALRKPGPRRWCGDRSASGGSACGEGSVGGSSGGVYGGYRVHRRPPAQAEAGMAGPVRYRLPEVAGRLPRARAGWSIGADQAPAEPLRELHALSPVPSLPCWPRPGVGLRPARRGARCLACPSPTWPVQLAEWGQCATIYPRGGVEARPHDL